MMEPPDGLVPEMRHRPVRSRERETAFGRRGARGRGSQPRTRAATGLRPAPLRGPARSWLTADRLRSVGGCEGHGPGALKPPEARPFATTAERSGS